MNRQSYATDVTEVEWQIMEPLMPAAKSGRHGEVTMREIVNGIFSIVRGGNAWRPMLHDLPLANRLWLLQRLEQGRHLGNDERSLAQSCTPAGRTR